MKEKFEVILNKIIQNKWKILIIITLLIGFFVRIVRISDIPNALNNDEASAGYEAYSILNYGIDRNRKS